MQLLIVIKGLLLSLTSRVAMLIRALLLSFLFITPAYANSDFFVESEGFAEITAGDLIDARRKALTMALDAALVQLGGAPVDGLLALEEQRTTPTSAITDYTVINERLIDNMLVLRIRANLDAQVSSCQLLMDPRRFNKRIAFAGFPIQQPLDANAGNLHEVSVKLPDLIAQQMKQHSGFETLLITRYNLHSHLNDAPTNLLQNGMLTNMQQHTEVSDAQFIVSGVIRDLSQRTPVGPREPNILVHRYHEFTKNNPRNHRNFVFDVFIYDAITGALIHQQSFATSGIWNAGQERTGFGTSAFWNQNYGQEVANLIRHTSLEIIKTLECKPFTARITQSEQNRIWINAGSLAGLNQGDRLSVLRRQTHYNSMNEGYPEFVPTQLSVTLDRVEPTFASGTLNTQASHVNIQRDDLVRSQ